MKLARNLVATMFACAALTVFAPSADASVVIAGTRVVYNQADSEVTVKLSNNGKLPGLVKVWMDKGDPDAAPDAIDVPFTITPPIMRIDPGKSQTLRIMATGAAMPAGKETIFYLNVLEIPPKPTGDDAAANQLQLAFRTRIKFFFRPGGLKGQVSDAPAQIVWHVAHDDKGNYVQASNSTPYFISFDHIEVSDAARAATFRRGGMVGPGETKTFPLQGDLPGDQAKVRYTTINDYGGPQTGEANVTH